MRDTLLRMAFATASPSCDVADGGPGVAAVCTSPGPPSVHKGCLKQSRYFQNFAKAEFRKGFDKLGGTTSNKPQSDDDEEKAKSEPESRRKRGQTVEEGRRQRPGCSVGRQTASGCARGNRRSTCSRRSACSQPYPTTVESVRRQSRPGRAARTGVVLCPYHGRHIAQPYVETMGRGGKRSGTTSRCAEATQVTTRSVNQCVKAVVAYGWSSPTATPPPVVPVESETSTTHEYECSRTRTHRP